VLLCPRCVLATPVSDGASGATAIPSDLKAGDREVAIRSQPGDDLLKRAAAYFAVERAPKMIYIFIAERCSDLPVSVCFRVMGVSTSGYYQRRRQPVTNSERVEAERANVVFDVWKMSRHSYGMPRVRDEFRLGRGEGCSRTTTARLMRICGAVGIHYKKRGGCTRPGDGELSDDLVNWAFDPEGPDRLWVMDIAEHPRHRQGLPGGGHRRVVATRRGLVDRRSHAGRAPR